MCISHISGLFVIAMYFTEIHCHIADPARVLLISFDGFRFDYLQKAKSIQNFQRVIKDGVISTHGLKNAFITKTLPNHYSLVTGLYEESHGLVGNTFFDPLFNRTFSLADKNDVRDSRWFDDGGEPVWVTNQKQGTNHRSGSVFWPGSVASVEGIFPTKYLEFDPHYPFNSRVDTIVQWFNDPQQSINLGLLYFEEPDETGHRFGPDSVEVAEKVEELDKVLGYLLEQLEKSGWLSAINIIVTSDHGMDLTPLDDEHKINLDNYIRVDSYSIFTGNPVADIHPRSEALKEEIYKNLSNVPHLTVYKRDEIPPQYHYSKNRRIAPILAVADEHYWLSHNGSQVPIGNHGYNNSLPNMHPFFIAMGPAFKKSASVEIFNNVDVYPLICHILELAPAPNNGTLDVVRQLLVSPPDRSENSTFLVYILIIFFTGLVSGIFGVAACHVHRTYLYRRRQFQTGSNGEFTKLDSIPLMIETSEDELNLDS